MTCRHVPGPYLGGRVGFQAEIRAMHHHWICIHRRTCFLEKIEGGEAANQVRGFARKRNHLLISVATEM